MFCHTLTNATHAAISKAQSDLQVSHENDIKKAQNEKKVVQKDLSSAKSRTRGLEEAKNKLEAEVSLYILQIHL